ncbi:MAG: polysaccharide biosynthesis tyrosine autokinase [bacterium]|nr:polysaccharide biosynthesis tyrosine autokinase [bacterium]
MEIKRVWDILLRRKWVIIQGFVIIFGIIMVATLLKPKTYMAECKLVVEGQGTQEALLRSIGLESISEMLFSANLGQGSSMMEVEILKMMSKPVLDKVAQKLDLRMSDGSYVPGPSLALIPQTFQWGAQRGLKIKPAKKSTSFSIQGYSPNPQEALDLSNTLAEVYLAEDVAKKHRETSDAARFADEQSKIAKRDWNDAKRRLREFQEEEGVVDIPSEVGSLISQIAGLRAQQNMMNLSLQELNNVEQNYQGQADLIGGTTISDENQISFLKSQLAELESNLQSSLSKYTENHPTILALQEKIIDLQKKLLKEKDVYEQSERIRADEVGKRIREYQANLAKFPSRIYTLTQLQLSSDTSEKTYEMLLDMKYRLNITKAMQISKIDIIEPAWRAKPYSPSVQNNAIIGALLGLIFGFGLAILIEYLDDSVKDADSIQVQLGLPLLASIPLMGRKETPLIAGSDASTQKKSVYFLREAFNILTHNIKLGSLDEKVRSIMVTSSIPEEGKSHIATNLAINMAQQGKNVLLVDTDFPRPFIYRFFGLENEIGLTEVILGEASIEEVLKPSGVDHLWIITTGPKPPNTTQLFESNQMKEFIKEAERLFDIVIFDTPPVFSLNDPVILGALADRTIVVASAGNISRPMLKQAVETLERGNSRILGIVLNKMQMEGTHYYYYYHSYNSLQESGFKKMASKPLQLLGLKKKSSRRRYRTKPI